MRGRLPRIAVAAAVAIGILLALLYRDRLDAEVLTQWVGSLGAAGPALFVVVYAAAAVLFLPGSLLTLAGGALFGPVWGTLFNLTGATLGAALAFLVARYVAADRVAAKSGGRIGQLMAGVEQEGWRFVAFVRLVPLFPFNLLNYALGLTRIRFVPYVVTSYVAMLPGAVAYTYLGYAGREAVAGGEGLVQKGLLALALLATAAFMPRLVARLRAPAPRTLDIGALHARLGGEQPPLVLDVRDGGDYDAGHIAGARNIPLPELAARIGELTPWQQRPIAVVCHTDRRSADAVRLLSGAGFADVSLVKEGMQRWARDGLPTET